MKSGRNSDTKPYFPLFVDDWQTSSRVRRMTYSERGIFIEALCIEWREGSMPTDLERWKRMFPGASDAELSEVMAAFPGGKNERLERERTIASELIAKSRLGAEKTNAKRADSERPAHAQRTPSARTANAQRTHVQVQVQEQVQEQVQAQTETQAVAASQPPRPRATRTGAHAELIRYWESEWLRTRGTPYAVEAKDGVAVAAVLKLACGDLGEAQRRADRLLGSSDTWMAQNASLGLLRARWNQLAVGVVDRKNEPKGFQGIRDYFGADGGGLHASA